METDYLDHIKGYKGYLLWKRDFFIIIYFIFFPNFCRDQQCLSSIVPCVVPGLILCSAPADHRVPLRVDVSMISLLPCTRYSCATLTYPIWNCPGAVTPGTSSLSCWRASTQEWGARGKLQHGQCWAGREQCWDSTGQEGLRAGLDTAFSKTKFCVLLNVIKVWRHKTGDVSWSSGSVTQVFCLMKSSVMLEKKKSILWYWIGRFFYCSIAG